MKDLWNYLSGKKTYIICLATLVYAVLGGLLNLLPWDQAVAMIFAALSVAGLRNGLSNSIEEILYLLTRKK